MTALLLLAPATPMLFQGQEFGASSPFLYFADHEPQLADTVRAGRAEFLAQFPSLKSPEMSGLFADPSDPATFERCKLDHREREAHAHVLALHRDLLRLRREEAAFRAQRKNGVDGAVLAGEAFLLRFFGEQPGDDRLLLINFGIDLDLNPAPEPLLAAPSDCEWTILWSSENPKYGGTGTPALDTAGSWRSPGHAAVVMKPKRAA
jgi:maltooligosyltrehalose trehalohydrolase